jgi:hypothetical protein
MARGAKIHGVATNAPFGPPMGDADIPSLKSGTDVSQDIALGHITLDAVKLLVAKNPAEAVDAVYTAMNPELKFDFQKGKMLVDAGISTEHVLLGFTGRGDERDRLGYEAAYYAIVDEFASPQTKLEIAKGMGWELVNERSFWRTNRRDMELAFNVKVRGGVKLPDVLEAQVEALGLTVEELYDDAVRNVWENWEADWQNLNDVSVSGFKDEHGWKSRCVHSSGRSGGYALPAVGRDSRSATTFKLDDLIDELETIRRDQEAGEDVNLSDHSFLRHIFLLAQFKCVIDEVMIDPEAAFIAYVEDFVSNKKAEVRNEVDKKCSELACLELMHGNGFLSGDNEKRRVKLEKELTALYGEFDADRFVQKYIHGRPFPSLGQEPDGEVMLVGTAKGGHHFWTEGGTGRIIVSDESSDDATRTKGKIGHLKDSDDGILYLDPERPITVSTGPDGNFMASVPLLTPNGEKSTTPAGVGDVEFILGHWKMDLRFQDPKK